METKPSSDRSEPLNSIDPILPVNFSLGGDLTILTRLSEDGTQAIYLGTIEPER